MKADKNLINALNDVLGFDVSDLEQCLDNGIGFGCTYKTIEEATKKCIEANTLGDFFGWEKLRVYEWFYKNKTSMGYVCMVESDIEKMQNNKEYRPI